MGDAQRRPGALQIALALVVVAVWGTNFVVIKVGLRDFPPFTFAALRFFFCAVPFVFVLARPKVPWRHLAAFGVLLGPGQFGLLYYAMRADISPGLASLVIQVQVFFTIGLSMWRFSERLSALPAVGAVFAGAGLATIALHLDQTITPVGVGLVLVAALAWAMANIVVKEAARGAATPFDMLAFVAWSSLFAVPPLVLIAWWMEGGSTAVHAITHATTAGWAAVAWQVIGNTLFGYVIWSRLLTRYDAAVVAPYALLVPVFGMGASAWLLAEPLPPWKLGAAAMVLAGIALTTLGARWKK